MLHQVHDTADGIAVALWGRFTADDLPAVRAVVAAMDEVPGRRCLLDLSGVVAIDAVAAGLLVLVREVAARLGVSLTLKPPRGPAAAALARARLVAAPAYDA